MSDAALVAEAELRKLAHVLDVETERLRVVADLPPAALRTLRSQVSDALFEADKVAFARVAAVSKAVPAAVTAKLSEAVLPPLIAARTAELLDPRRAAEIVSRMSETYLAEVSLRMDAGRAPRVVRAIPADRVAAVARELARRGEWVVIGGFVAHVSREALAASIAGYTGEQLLRIGFVLDDVARLDEIVGLISEQQLDDVVAAAAALRLWPEFEVLLANLSAPRRARLAERYAAAPAAVQAAYAAAAKSGELGPATLSLFEG